MATLACQQPFPGDIPHGPQPTSIWVKRWEVCWAPSPAPCEGACTSWIQVATCTFLRGEVTLPALCDWPRWKGCIGASDLPPDEYYRLHWVPEYRCADPLEDPYPCGLKQHWRAVWNRIETPRAWRMVSAAQACGHPSCCGSPEGGPGSNQCCSPLQ